VLLKEHLCRAARLETKRAAADRRIFPTNPRMIFYGGSLVALFETLSGDQLTGLAFLMPETFRWNGVFFGLVSQSGACSVSSIGERVRS
jgi:hypothetical protein